MGGGGGLADKVKGIKKHSWQLQNGHGDAKGGTGNTVSDTNREAPGRGRGTPQGHRAAGDVDV